MNKLNAWVATIIGVVLLLPLLTLDFLGMVGSGGAGDWIVAVLVLVAGVKGLMGQ